MTKVANKIFYYIIGCVVFIPGLIITLIGCYLGAAIIKVVSIFERNGS